MNLLRPAVCAAIGLAGLPAVAATQEWDTPRTREVVARAMARRADAEAAGSPRRWEAVARGMVLFLSQLGGDLATPRLVKADELAVEVYWEAPGRSKQTIVAWREQAWLPTDINYHRDHLGIVANDFGPLIRLGDGDEVRDVPHPLSTAGFEHYEFGLSDSVTIASGARTWQVYTLEVRPRDDSRPAVIGLLYLDRASGALVRFRFSFTRSAYREAGLDDITVVLENALQEGGYWLPWRQEIEIRRRIGPVDFPARGIIRGQWELDEFRVGDDAPPRATGGVSIDGLRAPGGDTTRWGGPLGQRVDSLIGPVDRLEFESLRRQLGQMVAGMGRAPGPPVRPAIGAVSDLARFNRVEGLRLGLGATLRLPRGGGTISPWLGFGLADHRLSGRLQVGIPVGERSGIRWTAERLVIDVGHEPVISPILNSVLAQELGQDRGDWVERRSVGVVWDHRSAGSLAMRVELAVEAWRSVNTVAVPARGSLGANPPLGNGGTFRVLRGEVRQDGSGGPTPGLGLLASAEVGTGLGEYLRLMGTGSWAGPAGQGELRLALSGGWGSPKLPRPRGFAVGGWGTLPGTPFRGYGGRRMVLARVEWLVGVPLPAWSLGSYPAVSGAVRLGPFLALAATGGELPGGTPWGGSGGAQAAVGAVVEGLFGLVRIEAGYGLRGRLLTGSVDLARAWWGIL